MPELIGPDDERYALSRGQFIGRPVEVLPRAVARCASAAEVAEALAVAGSAGWPFAVRGGGHSNAGHSSTAGLLLDLAPLDSVDVAGGTVTVGGGVRIGQVAAVLAPLGRLVPGGSCPSVGLVGAALGGGFGSHGRRHGLTCDALLAAEVVLADGRVVVADADRCQDLFWALRGAGGGNFGVVTTATFATVLAEPRVHVRLAWSLAHAVEVVGRWLEFAPGAPDEVSVEAVLLCPDHPDDEPRVLVVGAAPAADTLAPLLDRLPDPELAEVEPLPAAEAALLHATPHAVAARDPSEIPLVHERPGMATAKTEFFDRPLPAEAVRALVAHLAGRRVFGELREVAFTPWGGAYARVAPHATAFAHRDPAYLVKHTVLVGPNGAARRGGEALAWLAGSWAVVHPWGSGRAYVNFPDPDLPGWATAYHGPNLPALRAVKARYDPAGAFRHAQSIPSGGAG